MFLFDKELNVFNLFSECLLSFSFSYFVSLVPVRNYSFQCVRHSAHDASENLASITAGEAGLHCVRNNNTNETYSHLSS